MITNKQIRELRSEAGSAGDLEMVKICDRALNGSARARRECEKVINHARAQWEEGRDQRRRKNPSRYYQVYKYQGNVHDGRYLTSNSDGSMRWVLTREDAHKLTKAEATKMAAYIQRTYIGHTALVVPDNRNPWDVEGRVMTNPKRKGRGGNALSVASSRGFPYLDTDGGESQDGVWFNRFSKTADRAPPYLLVGLKGSKWIVRHKNPRRRRRARNPDQKYQLAKLHPRQALVLWYTGNGFQFSPDRKDAISYQGKSTARDNAYGIAQRTGSQIAVVPAASTTHAVEYHLLKGKV